MLPLSGPAAALGQDMLQAAQMALFDVGPNDVVLLPRDTGGTPEGARRAATELIGQQVEVIIGPLYSQAVQATSPIAQQAGIPVLAFSNVTSVATTGTYLLGFRPEEQVARVVQFALENVERRPEGRSAPGPERRRAGRAVRLRHHDGSRPGPDRSTGARRRLWCDRAAGAAPRRDRWRRRARDDRVLSAGYGRPLGGGTPGRRLRPAPGCARGRARAPRGAGRRRRAGRAAAPRDRWTPSARRRSMRS